MRLQKSPCGWGEEGCWPQRKDIGAIERFCMRLLPDEFGRGRVKGLRWPYRKRNSSVWIVADTQTWIRRSRAKDTKQGIWRVEDEEEESFKKVDARGVVGTSCSLDHMQWRNERRDAHTISHAHKGTRRSKKAIIARGGSCVTIKIKTILLQYRHERKLDVLKKSYIITNALKTVHTRGNSISCLKLIISRNRPIHHPKYRALFISLRRNLFLENLKGNDFPSWLETRDATK